MRTKFMDNEAPFKFFYDNVGAVLDFVEFVCFSG